jgi:hypothetical protein
MGWSPRPATRQRAWCTHILERAVSIDEPVTVHKVGATSFALDMCAEPPAVGFCDCPTTVWLQIATAQPNSSRCQRTRVPGQSRGSRSRAK